MIWPWPDKQAFSDDEIEHMLLICRALRHCYYNLHISVIPDKQFDTLDRELICILQRQHPGHPYISEVGAPVNHDVNVLKIANKILNENKKRRTK